MEPQNHQLKRNRRISNSVVQPIVKPDKIDNLDLMRRIVGDFLQPFEETLTAPEGPKRPEPHDTIPPLVGVEQCSGDFMRIENQAFSSLPREQPGNPEPVVPDAFEWEHGGLAEISASGKSSTSQQHRPLRGGTTATSEQLNGPARACMQQPSHISYLQRRSVHHQLNQSLDIPGESQPLPQRRVAFPEREREDDNYDERKIAQALSSALTVDPLCLEPVPVFSENLMTQLEADRDPAAVDFVAGGDVASQNLATRCPSRDPSLYGRTGRAELSPQPQQVEKSIERDHPQYNQMQTSMPPLSRVSPYRPEAEAFCARYYPAPFDVPSRAPIWRRHMRQHINEQDQIALKEHPSNLSVPEVIRAGSAISQEPGIGEQSMYRRQPSPQIQGWRSPLNASSPAFSPDNSGQQPARASYSAQVSPSRNNMERDNPGGQDSWFTPPHLLRSSLRSWEPISWKDLSASESNGTSGTVDFAPIPIYVTKGDGSNWSIPEPKVIAIPTGDDGTLKRYMISYAAVPLSVARELVIFPPHYQDSSVAPSSTPENTESSTSSCRAFTAPTDSTTPGIPSPSASISSSDENPASPGRSLQRDEAKRISSYPADENPRVLYSASSAETELGTPPMDVEETCTETLVTSNNTASNGGDALDRITHDMLVMEAAEASNPKKRRRRRSYVKKKKEV
jgi:hypothetical protein